MVSDMYIATRFLNTLYKKEEEYKFNTWISEFPTNYFKQFVEDGVKPFLKKYGYVLGFSESKLISYYIRWAYSYSKYPGEIVEFTKWAHSGLMDDYEWYLYKISQDDWNIFMKEWEIEGFLDNSDIGYKQQNDLVTFIWQCIDLNNSKEYYRYLELFGDNEDIEEYNNNYDENNAYGGDRRTY